MLGFTRDETLLGAQNKLAIWEMAAWGKQWGRQLGLQNTIYFWPKKQRAEAPAVASRRIRRTSISNGSVFQAKPNVAFQASCIIQSLFLMSDNSVDEGPQVKSSDSSFHRKHVHRGAQTLCATQNGEEHSSRPVQLYVYARRFQKKKKKRGNAEQTLRAGCGTLRTVRPTSWTCRFHPSSQAVAQAR